MPTNQLISKRQLHGDEATSLYYAGATLRELAKRFGVNDSTIKYWIDPEYRKSQLSNQKKKIRCRNSNQENLVARKNRANRKHSIVTYFVSCESSGYVKIGKTTNLITRVADLQAGNPYKLTVLGVTDENETGIHVKFSHYHFDREWFVLSDEIRQWVAENCKLQL